LGFLEKLKFFDKKQFKSWDERGQLLLIEIGKSPAAAISRGNCPKTTCCFSTFQTSFQSANGFAAPSYPNRPSSAF
jgi:hypothetical protein